MHITDKYTAFVVLHLPLLMADNIHIVIYPYLLKLFVFQLYRYNTHRMMRKPVAVLNVVSSCWLSLAMYSITQIHIGSYNMLWHLYTAILNAFCTITSYSAMFLAVYEITITTCGLYTEYMLQNTDSFESQMVVMVDRITVNRLVRSYIFNEPELDILTPDELENLSPVRCKGNVSDIAHGPMSCAICIDVLDMKLLHRTLRCGHSFHPECVDKWLTMSSRTCPLCKTRV